MNHEIINLLNENLIKDSKIKLLPVKITPKIAANLLELNFKNRPLKESALRKYSKAISQGCWRLNGETIVISESNSLLNGQHRLNACLRVGKPFETIVVWGVSDDAFTTIDDVTRRSGGDTLSIAGAKNAKKLAAVLKFIEEYKNGRLASPVNYSNHEYPGLLDKYPEAESSVRKCSSPETNLLPFRVLAGCHYLFSEKDKTLADLTLDQLVKAEGIYAGDPMYVLRHRLEKDLRSKTGRGDHLYCAAMFIKAWNAQRANKKIGSLRWITEGKARESFPVIK